MTAATQPATPARGLDAALTVGSAGGAVDEVFFPVVPPPGEPSTPPAAVPTPPAAWVATVLAVQAADGLAPFGVPPAASPWVAGRWRLSPWRPRLDVTALLEWADHLDTGWTAQRVCESVVAVHGFLADHPVTLTAESRRIPPPPVTVTERVLREIADAEQRQLAWELTEMPMSIEDEADPLGVLRSPVPAAPAVTAAPSPRSRASVAAGRGPS